MAPKPDTTAAPDPTDKGKIEARDPRIDDLQRSTEETSQRVNKLDNDLHWVKEALGQLLQKRSGEGEVSQLVRPSTATASQTQTPSTPVKPIGSRRGDGLLSLPSIAIPLSSRGNPFPVCQTEQKVDSPNPKLDSPSRKMDLPMYDGQNPDDWIFRVEKCFSLSRTPDEDRLELALACMTGCDVTWLRITQDREDLRDWNDFKDKLNKIFRPTRGGTLICQMLRLRQA